MKNQYLKPPRHDIERYSRMVDDFAWYSQGDIFVIAKLAKKLKRDYMQDITARKKQMLNAQK